MSQNHADLSKLIAEFGIKHDSKKLIPSSQLPQWVLDIPAPHGIKLAADVQPQMTYELEGDVSALKLVDLNKEGLANYSKYL